LVNFKLLIILKVRNKTWEIHGSRPKDQCDNYKECGSYSVCDTKASPVCQCVEDFSPKNEQAWKLRDWSDGCMRQTNLNCESDEFYEMENVKLPETSSVFVNRTMEIKECGNLCLRNCSCTAYSNAWLTAYGRGGCVMWFGELVDIKKYPAEGQDLYIRRAYKKLGQYA
jgi:hypothetical protein